MAKTKQSTDHVKIRSGGESGTMDHSLECQHCGQVQQIALPCESSIYIAICRVFIKLHAKCPPKS